MTLDTYILPDWLSSKFDRPIAVFGGGTSGVAASDLLLGLGAEVEIFDERGEDASRRGFSPEDAERFGLAVSSPGFAVGHAWLRVAQEAGLEVVPESDLGASLWAGPIIGITGTNGKTTLTEFLAHAFASAGMEAFACGNIGTPMSRLLADGRNREAIAVCEVSSFQAEQARRLRADYVLWTNFDEDHLDRHGSLRSYFESKLRLVELLRGEDAFYDASVLEHAKAFGLELPQGGLVEANRPPEELGVSGTLFECLPERSTYLMARALWLRMKLAEDELIEAANTFQKSPHRMELIDNIGGTLFWDDSKATNFHAVYGALERFERPVVWIGGGKDKGGDVERFVRRIAPSLHSAHLLGQTASRLAEAFSELGVAARVYESLDDATAGALQAAESGSNILLSPGFASLDMFEGYSQRGEAFGKAINNLKEQ